MQGSNTLLLRERGALQSTHSAVRAAQQKWQQGRSNVDHIVLQLDDVLGQAQSVSHGLGDQRKVFESSGLKLQNLTARFPVVNGLLNSIKRKKNRVRALRCVAAAAPDCVADACCWCAGHADPVRCDCELLSLLAHLLVEQVTHSTVFSLFRLVSMRLTL